MPIHYLDDYLFLGPPNSDECGAALQSALALCTELGVPISEEKLEGPATCIPFLSIVLDTELMQLRLPEEKLRRLLSTVQEWQSRKVCSKRELLSLIGQLQHACRVVRSGRSFLRRMINLASTTRELHHHVRLNGNFKSDLMWWATFLLSWNGTGMMSSVLGSAPRAMVTPDASDWGCGAFNSFGQWFQMKWPSSWEGVHITFKELLPVVVAVALWGHLWRGRTVLCRCDNAAVVSIVGSGRSTHELAMHLMRSMFFYTAVHQLVVVTEHVAGRDNEVADAISRNRSAVFHSLIPQVCLRATVVPVELINILITTQPDWTSSDWRSLFSSILRRA